MDRSCYVFGICLGAFLDGIRENLVTRLKYQKDM